MRIAACMSSFVTSPYQYTHFSSGPRIGSAPRSIPLTSCVKTSSSISGLAKNSRERGCAYCSHCRITAFISSSVRATKVASFRCDVDNGVAFLAPLFLPPAPALWRFPPASHWKGLSEHILQLNMVEYWQIPKWRVLET
eukprot:CAMPEP_0194511526 /NCGR_PEP_ID=MMETSP0253-20130528/43242_1 /TAXON_ID=2966 /ORGANISM="Noctiluca scintillans" /LENGTH=138 /DNA_ID=CAMNT_0039354865 /DNA_START=341 /DNA_END=757 /DNA_ORIENTATION=-